MQPAKYVQNCWPVVSAVRSRSACADGDHRVAAHLVVAVGEVGDVAAVKGRRAELVKVAGALGKDRQFGCPVEPDGGLFGAQSDMHAGLQGAREQVLSAEPSGEFDGTVTEHARFCRGPGEGERVSQAGHCVDVQRIRWIARDASKCVAEQLDGSTSRSGGPPRGRLVADGGPETVAR